MYYIFLPLISLIHYIVSTFEFYTATGTLNLDSSAQIGRIIHSVSREKGVFHRCLFLVADKSAARSAKDAIDASRARGESREDARFLVQHETIGDDGLPARLLLRKFPPIWKYARVSLG